MTNHDRFIRRTKDKIGRAGISTLIGAVDWSFNEDKDSNRKRWSTHVHAVIPDGDPESIRKNLKKQFPGSRDVRKPVLIGGSKPASASSLSRANCSWALSSVSVRTSVACLMLRSSHRP